MILVTGFGPFPGVPDNPTAALARAVDGRRVGGALVAGLVLPVSFARGPALTLDAARALGARLVVGLGVASTRDAVCVERCARRACGPALDVDGAAPPVPGNGPALVRATLDVERLAAALGAALSDDAGNYVCNAWLYRVAQALSVPVGFVHVPPAGLAPERLLAGLEALWEG